MATRANDQVMHPIDVESLGAQDVNAHPAVARPLTATGEVLLLLGVCVDPACEIRRREGAAIGRAVGRSASLYRCGYRCFVLVADRSSARS